MSTAPAAAAAAPPRRPRFVAAASRLVGVDALTLVLGFVTAPLIARALGADGRGTLAAILVPFTLAPLVFEFGIGGYVARQAARGRPLGPLIGSMGAVSLVYAAAGLAICLTFVDTLAEGRDTVRTFLIAGFVLMLTALPTGVLLAINAGLERWNRVIAHSLIRQIGATVGVVVLFVGGWLTVSTAAALQMVVPLVAAVPLLAVLIGAGRLRVERAVVREGVPFGLRAWPASIGSLANARLDQLLMIPLVAPRELGLYAVAVTIAGLGGVLTSGVAGPLFARTASGEVEMAPRALRICLVAVCAGGLALALITPPLLSIVFGDEFTDAAPLVWVLLVAAVPLAAIQLLGPCLVALGRPGIPSWGQGIGLVVTAVGLIVLLPAWGAMGAAVVSLAAYSATAAFLLMLARRQVGGRWREWLAPTAGDVRWALALLRARAGGGGGAA